MQIYDQVKKMADKKGFTIAQIERESGLSNGTIRKWNTAMPTVNNLFKVAGVLNVSVEDLFGQHETLPSKTSNASK